MPEYIVYRLPERQPVARLTADSPEQACRLAEPGVRLLAGQRLTAEPAEDVDAHVHTISLRVEALDNPEGGGR